MARRKSGLFDELASAPWPVGLGFGVVGFAVLRFVLPAFLRTNPNTSAIADGLAGGALAPFAWVVLAMGALASVVSFLIAKRRQRILDSRTGLDSLRAISWRDFEALVAELFTRRGYAVEIAGGGGADGGVDLVLKRTGLIEIVQCKQWRQRQVPVTTAREMFGLLQHHGAARAWIVCCGEFTADAQAFVAGKSIELLTGAALLESIRAVQSSLRSPMDAAVAVPTENPNCPNCSRPLVRRTNRRNGESFWGCASYPSCRGTRPFAGAGF